MAAAKSDINIRGIRLSKDGTIVPDTPPQQPATFLGYQFRTLYAEPGINPDITQRAGEYAGEQLSAVADQTVKQIGQGISDSWARHGVDIAIGFVGLMLVIISLFAIASSVKPI